MFIVTEDWIREHCSARGGWTRDQLEVLGAPWPPVQGWIGRAVGQSISPAQRERFEAGRRSKQARAVEGGQRVLL